MKSREHVQSNSSLKLLPAYTGLDTMDEVLNSPRALRLLWLEILLNENLNLTPWLQHPEVQQAHEKACRWYTTYKTLVNSMISRGPLPHNPHPVDYREYRVFAEALRLATAHS